MQNLLKKGQDVICNGHIGYVTELLEWAEYKMANVRVPGGLVCVSVSDLKNIDGTWIIPR